MVKAIQERRKSQTRRIIKPSSEICIPLIPPYQEGDVLWVRETWGIVQPSGGTPDGINYDPWYIYKADSPDIKWLNKEFNLFEFKWRPSIHMPRKAARIFLKVKNVWVERLQDITEEDAKAEGVKWLPEISAYRNYLWHGNHDVPKNLVELWPYQYSGYSSARDSFSSLWQLLYAKRGYGWETNPKVWVIEFEKLK